MFCHAYVISQSACGKSWLNFHLYSIGAHGFVYFPSQLSREAAAFPLGRLWSVFTCRRLLSKSPLCARVRSSGTPPPILSRRGAFPVASRSTLRVSCRRPRDVCIVVQLMLLCWRFLAVEMSAASPSGLAPWASRLWCCRLPLSPSPKFQI
jgi:hypothetical protein